MLSILHCILHSNQLPSLTIEHDAAVHHEAMEKFRICNSTMKVEKYIGFILTDTLKEVDEDTCCWTAWLGHVVSTGRTAAAAMCWTQRARQQCMPHSTPKPAESVNATSAVYSSDTYYLT